GNYELKRDINLSKPFLANLSAEKNLDLWAYWQRVTIPTLVVRGAISDILSAATVLKMQQVNPHTKSVEVKDVGHAPFLYNDEHFTFLSEFLA
ncbi:MAG: alpha/beta fold hydrolase, partial [Burkholderiales bacterium]